MSLLNMIGELGDDVDLLSYNDNWLQSQKVSLANKVQNLSRELNAIIVAQDIKRRLQNQNIIPVRKIQTNEDGDIIEASIIISKASKAKKLINNDTIVGKLNSIVQLNNWTEDGYELE